MKRLFLFSLYIILPLSVMAQTKGGKGNDGKAASDTVSLKEVVVKGERVMNRDNTLRLLPTQEQKEASTTGYGLLSRLALPYVTVDEVAKSITVPPNMGQLQVRINDIVADRHDLTALDPKTVRSVDFIQNPGVRYGQGVTFVVNIVTNRTERGYTVGAELMQTLTSERTNGEAFAKLNHGKSELGVHYSFGFADMKKLEYEEKADYLMPDNSTYAIRRTDDDWRRRSLSHDLQLQYSLADTSRYTLQATLGGTLSRIPRDTRTRTETQGGTGEAFSIGSTDDTKAAMADMYFNYNLTKRQSLTVNANGNYTLSTYDYAYGGTSPYAYTSRSTVRTLFAEAIYENRLRPFTLSAGLTFDHNHTGITYRGDTDVDNNILTQSLYAFAQVRGRLAGLSYTAGTGVSYLHYRQGAERYSYWLWRPEVQLSWSPWRPFRLNYNLQMRQEAPRLAYLGDAVVRNNALEFTVGNPAIRPNRVVEQTLTASLQLPSLYTSVSTHYRSHLNTWMQKIERVQQTSDELTSRQAVSGDVPDNVYFLFSRANQRRVSMFYVDNYTRYDPLPGKLSLMFFGGLYRCFNYGDDYTHHSSAFNWGAGADAYLGRLSLSAHVDNGWSFLEGETKGIGTYAYYLTASYRMGNFNVSLYWQHCFQNRVETNHSELLNRYVHKTLRMYSGDMGNMLTLSLSWRLSKGREHKAVSRNAVKRGGDTGIIKN